MQQQSAPTEDGRAGPDFAHLYEEYAAADDEYRVWVRAALDDDTSASGAAQDSGRAFVPATTSLSAAIDSAGSTENCQRVAPDIAVMTQARLELAWRAAGDDPPVVNARPLPAPFWAEVRLAATLGHLPSCTPIVVSDVSLRAVLSHLVLASGKDHVAEALAAAQLFLHVCYLRCPELRKPIRRGLMNVADALAARVEAIGDTADALILGSVIRLLRPLVAGLGDAERSQRWVTSRLLPLLRASHSPKAHDAYGTALADTVRASVESLPEADQDRVAAEVLRAVDGHASTANHFKLAGCVRLVGELAVSLSATAYAASRHQLMAVICRAIESEVAAVATAGTLAARQGLVGFLQRDDAGEDHVALAKAIVGSSGSLHWDIDTVIEHGKLWRELDEVLGERWVQAADAAMSLPTFKSASRDFPARLLKKTDEVLAARAADQLAAESRREEAYSNLAARAPLVHRYFVYGRELGEGAFAVVRFAKFIEREVPQSQWQPIAIKAVRRDLMQLTPEGREALQREIDVHGSLSEDGQLRHGIVRLLGVFEDPQHTNLVQELCPGGDMHAAVTASGAVNHVENGVFAVKGMGAWVKSVLYTVAHTLQGVHEAGVMYGDLKPENVLLTAAGTAKLCDFGSALPLASVPTAVALGGTVHYAAPEVASSGCSAADGRALDWWAFAITTVFCLTGKLPIDEATEANTRQRIAALASKNGDEVRDLLGRALGAGLGLLPEFVITIMSMGHGERGSEGFATVTSDPFFVDMPPPFSSKSRPAMPLRLRTAAAATAKSSGRKQSVMWRRHTGADAQLDGDGSAAAVLDVVSGARHMPAEAPTVEPLFDYTEFALPNPQAAAPRVGGGGMLLGMRGGRGRGGGGDMSGYMTVLPRGRR